jgi:putative PIN family toxin of toxin-antitoxin system
MKIVVDTNVFVSALLKADSAPRQVIRLCLEGTVMPIIGNALFSEYEDVCNRDQLFSRCPIGRKERMLLLDAFLGSCQWVPIYFLWRPNLRDEADNHVVELAIAGGANVIVTANKRDFAAAELAFPDLQILNAAEFLRWRQNI